MATMNLGQPRTYYAGGNVYVNRGKFRGLSEADDALMEIITNPGRKHTVELTNSDIELLEQKHEAGIYRSFGAKSANYTSNTPGSGQEFAPVSVAGQIIDQVNLLSKVRGNHQIFHATSDPFKIPLNESQISVQVFPPGYSQGDVLTPSGTTTGELTIKHAKLVASTEVSTEFEEDSVQQSLAFLKRHMGTAIARVEEKALFFNEDPDGAGSGTPYANVFGMAQSNTSVSAAASKDLTIMNAIKALGKSYQGDSEDLILYLDVGAYRDLQATGKVATVDQYGPKATIVTGELSRIWGVPIAVTDQLVQNQAYLVYRPAAIISQRRALTLRSFPIKDDKTRIEATVRVAMDWPYGLGGASRPLTNGATCVKIATL